MIRVGFVLDFSTDNADEQRYAVHDLERNIGGEYEVVWAGDAHAMGSLPDVDLLLVDYGGLAGSYGAAVEVYGEAIRRWADEHPGKPVVLWTAYTASCYRAIFEDFEKEAGNVMSRYRGITDWDGYADLWDRLRAWLGLPEGAPRDISITREVEAAGPLVPPTWIGEVV